MRPNVDRNRVILALKRAIEATFDAGKWHELGYLTNSIEIIEGHSRLLRSLYWEDPDYGRNLLQVLPRILGSNFENIEVVEKFVNLKDWLYKNDPELFAELYDATPISLEEIERVGEIRSIPELNQEINRIRHSIPDDPALAVGSAKELLETVLKTILKRYGSNTGADDISTLLKKAQKELDLDFKTIDKSTREDKILFRTLNNLGQVVIGIGEIRNLVGTGHGRSKGSQIDTIHARLVVNAAATVATYFLEVWEAQKRP